MPGKQGGFFRRLKSKEAQSGGKRKRGTTGLKREDRVQKHNALVDFYAAQRHLEDLRAVSDSSSEGTDSSEDERAPETSMSALRRMLGCNPAAGPAPRAPGQAAAMADDDDDDLLPPVSDEDEDSDEDGSVAASTDSVVSDLDFDEEEEEGEECVDTAALFAGADAAEDEGPMLNPDDYVIVPEGEEFPEDEEFEEGEDDEEMDFEEEEEGEEEEGEEEEGEEDAFTDDGLGSASGDSDREAALEEEDGDAQEDAAFLETFDYGTADATVIAKTVRPDDPWFVKYMADDLGAPDTTDLAPLPDSAQVFPDSAVQGTVHAARRLKALWARAAPCEGAEGAAARPDFVAPLAWKMFAAYRERTERPASLQRDELQLLTQLSTYSDVASSVRQWATEGLQMEMTALHVVNHWCKASAIVAAHDAMLRKAGPASDLELRDRGYGKTRVLFMLPMRNIALRYVKLILDIVGVAADSVHKLDVFERDFSELEENVDPNFHRRPQDYQKQFDGNIDDTFCFGVSLKPRRAAIYSHVLNSDIIFCSPLGLRRRLAKEADVLVSLASVEVCVVDQADTILMQNWEHAEAVLGMLNKQPRDTTQGLADLRRVYSWALKGKMRRHRQTIMAAEVSHAVLLRSQRELCSNSSGRLGHLPTNAKGLLPLVKVPVRQHFVRFANYGEPGDADDERFNHFTGDLFHTKVRPLIERSVRTMLFVPSYFDFLRLRKFLDDHHRGQFCELTEYTTPKAQRKALGQFSALERSLLVVTERFYFFSRYFVKHVEALVFYAPPVRSSFYLSLIEKLVAESPNAQVLTACCRYDVHELSRLLGTARASQVLTRKNNTFVFMSQGTA